MADNKGQMEEGREGYRSPVEKKTSAEKLLGEKEGESLVRDVKKAVFEEYDRALLEGTATKREVELQKKHVGAVAILGKKAAGRAMELLESKGRAFSAEEKLVAERTVEIYAYLHDALKIVPERKKMFFSLEEIREIQEQVKELERKLHKGQKKDDMPSETGGTREEIEKELTDLKSLLGGDLEEYLEKSLEHSGQVEWVTKLLLHGEDSAAWAEQLLLDLGFSNDFIKKTKIDLRAHMPMPFVEKQLEMAEGEKDMRLQYVMRSLSEAWDATVKGDLALARGKTAKFERQKALLDKQIILPEHLDWRGKFPQPRGFKAAALLVADFLSPMVMAGEDIGIDPEGGCFDRYINLGLEQGSSFEKAFSRALGSLEDNVKRLSDPPDEENRPEAALVERALGEEFGGPAIEKIKNFKKSLEQGLEIEVEESGETKRETVRSLEEIEVSEVGSDGKRTVDRPATMNRYYQAVGAYRKKAGLDPSKIEER